MGRTWSGTAHRIASRHSDGWFRNHLAALSAVPARHYVQELVTANVHHRGAPPLLPPPALPPEQGLVHPYCFHGTEPRNIGFQQRVSPPDDLTVHRVPNYIPTLRPPPTPCAPDAPPAEWPTAQREASTSPVPAPPTGPVPQDDPTAHVGSGHIQRRFCHRNRTGRPNAGKSTKRTSLSPLDHTLPPHPTHTGRGPRNRIVTLRRSPANSSTPTRSTSPSPTSRASHIYSVNVDAIGDLVAPRAAPIDGEGSPEPLQSPPPSKYRRRRAGRRYRQPLWSVPELHAP